MEITETPNTINEIGCAFKEAHDVKKQNNLWTDSGYGKFTGHPAFHTVDKTDNPF